ncbi:MAG: 3-deoxy-manno-octulosonate cytidylyltransferase [Phycisphaerales bacterium]
MTPIIIIPARLGSTRFPEKVLASDTGTPLVQHVVEASRRATCLEGAGEVIVAADDPRIAAALRPYGTRVVLTRADHANGTSRLAEAAALLDLPMDQVIVNAQGDEPEMPGEAIDGAVQALMAHDEAQIGTVAAPLAAGDDPSDPAIVKVVRAVSGLALYFSRAPIPCDRDRRGRPGATPLRHVGVYAYRRRFLELYARLDSTPLERAEQLEQLRALEHGYRIGVGLIGSAHAGIDTPQQYAAFVERFRRGGGAGA